MVVFGVKKGFPSQACLVSGQSLLVCGFGCLDGLHLVEDGLGELVGGGHAAHVASANLAIEVVSQTSLLVDTK